MKDLLISMFETNQPLSFQEVMLILVAGAVAGLVIYFSYWVTHVGTVYSKKFGVSLIMLTELTAVVMAVIGNNVAMSLGMVGALSIVRFRTAIKDSRDTAYIFWAVIGGICCGAQDFLIVACGSAVVFILLMLFGRVKNDDRMLLVVRGARSLERDMEMVVFTSFRKRARLKVKNSTGEKVELIYEISKKQYEELRKKPESLLEQFYSLGDIDYVNAVSQSDDIA